MYRIFALTSILTIVPHPGGIIPMRLQRLDDQDPKTSGRPRRQPFQSTGFCMDVSGLMVYDWVPSQAAMTAVFPSGASATVLRGQPLHFIQA